MLKLSQRGASAPESPIRKLVPLADAARERGLHVFQLNIGQPDIETPEVMRRGLKEYEDTVVSYGPSGGDAEFRKFLVEYYASINVQLEAENLVVTTGGSEAIVFALASCLDPGDQVLVPDPMYANYIGFGALLGNQVVPIPTRVEEGYHLPENLDDFVTAQTRAIIVCNPANPTGAVYGEAEIQRIVDLALKHDLYIIADEVYREFVYDGPIPASMLTYEAVKDRVVVVDSLSKRYSLCGGRLGCMVSGNKEIVKTAMKFAQARLSPPALAQQLGARAGQVPQSYFEDVRAEYKKRRDVVYEALASVDGVTVHRPEGAFYIMARLPVPDAEEFVRFMLNDFELDGATTMVAPGGGFYASPGMGVDEVRIAYVLNEGDLRRAMAVLVAALEVFPKRIAQ